LTGGECTELYPGRAKLSSKTIRYF